PRFVTVRERLQNSAALIAMLDEIIAARTLEDWATAFDAHDVFWGKVQNVGEVVEDAQARSNGAFRSVTLGTGKTIEIVSSPAEFSETPAEIRAAAPELGEHTEEVLLALGYTWEEIATLKDAGAIG